MLEIDHLILASPNLQQSIVDCEKKFGAKIYPINTSAESPVHNAIIPLKNAQYIEILAPNPNFQDPGPLPFNLGNLKVAKLMGWALRTNDIEATHKLFEGFEIGVSDVAYASVDLVGGRSNGWNYFYINDQEFEHVDMLTPFFIQPENLDFLDSYVCQCEVTKIQLLDSGSKKLRSLFKQLNFPVEIVGAPETGITIELETPRGKIQLF